MADLETLKGLRAKFQGAAHGSHLLDADLAHWLYESRAAGGVVNYDPDLYVIRNGGWTEELGSATNLVEAALPGACLEITIGAHKDGRRISTAFIRLGDHDLGECWEAATAPLAVCSALLSALIAQAEREASDGVR